MVHLSGARHERGGVAIIVAVCALVLVGFASIVIDLGNARQLDIKAQGAADAAALGGAQDLPPSGSDETATSTAKAQAATLAAAPYNLPAVPVACGGGVSAETSCSTVGTGVTVEVTSPYLGVDQKIHVRVCEVSPTFFAGALGLASPVACSHAVAVSATPIEQAPAVLTLNEHACAAMQLHSSADTVTVGGGIQVNSDCAGSALTQEGSGANFVSDTCVCVVGGKSMEKPANASPGVTTGAVPVANPYAAVPAVPQPAVAMAKTGVTYHPGTYNSKISLSGSTTFIFEPGIYYLKAGIKMEGNANIEGHNVMIYIAGGGIDWGGDSHKVHLTPLNPAWDPTGTYRNIVLYQAPGNATQIEYGDTTVAGATTGSGTSMACNISHSDGGFEGGVYAPSATIKLRGTVTLCATGPVVADKINQEGSSLLYVDASSYVSADLGETFFRLVG